MLDRDAKVTKYIARNIKSIARHEAGHAVAEAIAGHDFEYVTIAAPGPHVLLSPDAVYHKNRIVSVCFVIMCKLSGCAAEAVFSKQSFNSRLLLTGMDDWAEAKLIREEALQRFQNPPTLETLVKLTMAFVCRERKAIHAMATALLQRETLTAEECWALINLHCSGKPMVLSLPRCELKKAAA